MERSACIQALDMAKDWDSFKKTLRDGIAQAKGYGFSDEQLEDIAADIGDFLNKRVCPGSKEQELLKEMWDASSSDQRRCLASILFNMVK
ncbi:MAG: DUF3243 family protein [Thermodesulfovibrionales bacterium]